MPRDTQFTFRALKVSMNFSSSSGGRKSPIKCFPRPIFVSCSAHSARRDRKGKRRKGERLQGREAAGGDPDLNPASPGKPCTLLLLLRKWRHREAKSCAQDLIGKQVSGASRFPHTRPQPGALAHPESCPSPCAVAGAPRYPAHYPPPRHCHSRAGAAAAPFPTATACPALHACAA